MHFITPHAPYPFDDAVMHESMCANAVAVFLPVSHFQAHCSNSDIRCHRFFSIPRSTCDINSAAWVPH